MSKEDCWYLLNFVLNAVAEQFSHGRSRRDAGETMHTVTYAVCLTCEIVGEERIRKVRTMLARREILEDFPYLDKLPQAGESLARNARPDPAQSGGGLQDPPGELPPHGNLCVRCSTASGRQSLAWRRPGWGWPWRASGSTRSRGLAEAEKGSGRARPRISALDFCRSTLGYHSLAEPWAGSWPRQSDTQARASCPALGSDIARNLAALSRSLPSRNLARPR